MIKSLMNVFQQLKMSKKSMMNETNNAIARIYSAMTMRRRKSRKKRRKRMLEFSRLLKMGKRKMMMRKLKAQQSRKIKHHLSNPKTKKSKQCLNDNRV